MAIANVACSKCAQTFRSTDDVKGTRINCPLCGAAFVVKQFAPDTGPRLADPKKKSPAGDDDDNPNPYGVGDIKITARCPNCANEMAEDAIICVFCGYNTQTRSLGKTERVVAQTKSDALKWLGPGLGCVAGILAVVLLQNLYVLYWGAGMRGGSGIVALLFSEPLFIWATIMAVGAIWVMGQFAFKRLILQPTPPEESVD